MPTNVFIGADHGGFVFKGELTAFLIENGFSVTDCGADAFVADDDYPVIAARVARKMLEVENQPVFGVLLCRSGAGMTIVSNRFPDIRAVDVFSEQQAKHAREHNNANVLALSGDWLNLEEMKKIALAFLQTPFSGEERHLRRLKQLSELEA
ncbi:MAG: ribose-5-phosphate isomerase [Candidatus Pacebacteria bacterium CG_4_10_14_0_8_um_filter_42_14]|nr:MAG: ribose-5-phosphate isomerase [Candidatus Pacebacteria bacterium CG_4_10_14_0_8_um_filter_42_14]